MSVVKIGQANYSLGKEIGAGGEGTIYLIAGRPDKAVKIYKKKLRRSRERKINAIIQAKISEKTALAAYPSDIVTSEEDEFLGFMMNLVTNHLPIHELYGVKSRKKYFPKADYRFLIRAAINMAKAVANIHSIDCIIGDFNHSGILVSHDATVALIDVDSFQFKHGKELFHCLVGVPDYTPPELQCRKLSTVTRTKNHDHFGLAVAIFHLLFMGRHPYAGVYRGKSDLSLEESIKQNRFAYSTIRERETQTAPPSTAIKTHDYPPSFVSTVERAFGIRAELRPTASEWIDELTKLEKSLKECAVVSSHYSPASSKNCVWCDALEQGVDFFPAPIRRIVKSTASPVQNDFMATLNKARLLASPKIEDFIPQVPLPTEPSRAYEKSQKNSLANIISALCIAAAASGFYYDYKCWWGWIAVSLISYLFLSKIKTNPSTFRETLANKDHALQLALDQFFKRSELTDFLQKKQELDQLISLHQQVDFKTKETIRKLITHDKQNQTQAHLDNFYIKHAKIAGIGPVKKSKLLSFGIETAADITVKNILAVPGFGDSNAKKLMSWKTHIESGFSYTASKNDLAEMEGNIRQTFSNTRSLIEKRITSLYRDLNAISIDNIISKARGHSKIIAATQERLLAAYDLEVLGETPDKAGLRLPALEITQPMVKLPTTESF